jgi:hypothetical protein
MQIVEDAQAFPLAVLYSVQPCRWQRNGIGATLRDVTRFLTFLSWPASLIVAAGCHLCTCFRMLYPFFLYPEPMTAAHTQPALDCAA